LTTFLQNLFFQVLEDAWYRSPYYFHCPSFINFISLCRQEFSEAMIKGNTPIYETQTENPALLSAALEATSSVQPSNNYGNYFSFQTLPRDNTSERQLREEPLSVLNYSHRLDVAVIKRNAWYVLW
jgi:hypothetical protein